MMTINILQRLGDIGLIIACLIVAVFVTELIKLGIEKLRLKKVSEAVEKVIDADGVEEEQVVYYLPDGTIYKKLRATYQSIAFLLAFIGIGIVLYFFSGIKDWATVLGLALLLAGAEAKAYEIYETAGIRGFFRYIGDKYKSARTLKDIVEITDTPEPLKMVKDAIEEIKPKKAKKVKLKDKDVIAYLSQKSGRSENYVSAYLNQLKK